MPPWIGGSFIAWGRRNCTAVSVRRPAATPLSRSTVARSGPNPNSSVTRSTSSPGPPTFTATTFISGRSSKRPGVTGAKLVVIDPYRTRTAGLADWHVPINPGTDVALALGLMHVIVRDGLHDRDYIARYAEGFDELEKRLPEYTPERVAQWTGISRDDIERSAREYATTRPASIRLNYGIQRSQLS